MKTKAEKRKGAEERRAARAARSDAEQLAVLDARFETARRERRRLTHAQETAA